jgi:beta-mannosidase
MSEVFGEWRRSGSRCGGGLVLWLHDLAAGAGWGVVDHHGEPKVAYHHLRRALAPRAVWSTDEGLSGIAAHVANDTAEALDARLRVALYRDMELRVAELVHPIELTAHGAWTFDVESLLGRFVDISWAYRFGPAAQDLVAFSLECERDGTIDLLSQAFRLPAGRPHARESGEDLGLVARIDRDRSGEPALHVESRRFAYGVRIHSPDFRAEDDAFSIEPGGSRSVRLTRVAESQGSGHGTLTSLNLLGSVEIQ